MRTLTGYAMISVMAIMLSWLLTGGIAGIIFWLAIWPLAMHVSKALLSWTTDQGPERKSSRQEGQDRALSEKSAA